MGYSDDELYRKHLKGEISDDEYLAGIEANCKHVGKVEEQGSKWTEWCDKCGMKLDEGYYSDGPSGAVKVSSKGGCVVIAFLLLGIMTTGLYSFFELVT